MSTSLILPCAQPPPYVSPTSLKTSVRDRSPALLNFGSFSPYGSCQNPTRDSSIRNPSKVQGHPSSTTKVQSVPPSHHTSSIARPHSHVPSLTTFQPIPPLEGSTNLSAKSPTSPLSISSPTSLKLFNSGYPLKKSQSTLIMPNIITFLRQGQATPASSSQSNSSIRPGRRKDEAYSFDDLRRGSSTSCLSTFVGGGEPAVFGEDTASPQPLIRKCHTVIALSGNSKGTPSLPHTKVVRDKKTKLNFLRRMSSSKSAIFLSNRTAPSGVRRSPSAIHASQRIRKSSLWPNLEEEECLDPLPERFDSASMKGCSRCASTTSLASSRRNSAYGYEALFCKLCLSEVSINEVYQLQQCLCRFCTGCMEMYTTLKIREGESVIECPDSNCDCSGELLLEEVEALVGRDLFSLHLQFRRNREIDLDPFKTWCPTPGCETVVPLGLSKIDGFPQCCSCPSCKVAFCGTCLLHWHPGKPCHPADTNLEVPMNDLIKRCPRCKVPIERDAGCAQMQCKKCKHVFCWYCLTSLEDDFLLRHYDKGPCKNKLGHSRASVLWHRAQVVIIFAGFGLLLVVASPVLLFIGPCLLFRTCRGRSAKYDLEDDRSSVI